MYRTVLMYCHLLTVLQHKRWWISPASVGQKQKVPGCFLQVFLACKVSALSVFGSNFVLMQTDKSLEPNYSQHHHTTSLHSHTRAHTHINTHKSVVDKKKLWCEQIGTLATKKQFAAQRSSKKCWIHTIRRECRHCVSHLCNGAAQTSAHNLLIPTRHFVLSPQRNSSLSLRLSSAPSTTLGLPSASFVSLRPSIYLKARPAGSGCFPHRPERPVFSPPFLHLSLGLSAGREREGCGSLKGRTPDGHRHVGHVLCDGLWLRAMWASHSCQS